MAAEAKLKPKDTDKRSKAGLWVAFIVGLILLCVSAAIAHSHTLSGFQARIFYDVNNLHDGMTTPALWVTEGLGAGYAIAACVLIPLIFKKYRLAWRFFFTVGGAFTAAYVVKKIVDEPRPLAMLHGHLHQRAIETGPGFPSGHQAAATALALTLWFILPPKWRWLSALWILVVAWSRLYLGVHTGADVVGGFAIGLMAVCVVRLLPAPIARSLRLNED
jgi:membrane-associated phospholipid phosphatase